LSKWKSIEPERLADDFSTSCKRDVDVEVITDFAKFLLANSLAFDPKQGAWKQFVDQQNAMQGWRSSYYPNAIWWWLRQSFDKRMIGNEQKLFAHLSQFISTSQSVG